MRHVAQLSIFLFLLSAPAFALGCNPGEVECVDNYSFHECNEYALWGDTISCLAGQECISGICEMKLGCSPGVRECVGAASYKVCNNYAIWDPEAPCPSGQLCSNGACYSPFPKQCDYSGQIRCNPSDSDEVQMCNGNFQWEHKQTCDYGCQNGYCRSCRPNMARCTGTYTYQSCNSDGTWGSEGRCQVNYVCDAGNCIISPSLKCTSIGSYRCSPDSASTLQQCRSNYQWSDYTYCPLGCSSGACKVCNYGDRKCKVGNTYINCGVGGQWGGETSCPTGYFCYAGSCQVPSGSQCSTQGAMRCSPSDTSMIQICSANGVYADYQVCSYGCINGVCADCKAGTSVCSGSSAVKTCGANGRYSVPQNCASGYACSNGNCIQTAVCSEGQRSCMSNNVYTCKDGQWAIYLTCPSSSSCVESQGTAYCEAKAAPAPTPSPQPIPSPSPTPEKDSGIGTAALALGAVAIIGGAAYFMFIRKKD